MLRIINGNCQEVLYRHLAAGLTHRDPLAPVWIVTESGIDRWLRQQLARDHGIAANIRCERPAGFLWQTLRRLLGSDAVPGHTGEAWDREVMAFRILRLLPPLLDLEDFHPLVHWLDRDATAATPAGEPVVANRRLLQLARRIAEVFDGYLVYRPEMIAQWEAGQSCRPGGGLAAAAQAAERWQRRLWQALVADTSEPHRVALARDFFDRHRNHKLRRPDDVPERVRMFGIPALPPLYAQLLVALGDLLDIEIYLLAPSEEFWGDQLPPKAAAKAARDAGDDAYLYDIRNRLLAANGQPVRRFHAGLGEHANEPFCYRTPVGDSLLARVQADLHRLTESTGIARAAGDDSIHVASAWGPMREVEALRDWLLARFAGDETLAPHDVLVMVPDIVAFAPFIDAVFGTPAPGDAGHIPYAIADLPLRGSDPVAIACEQLLRLPDSRLTVNEILALLETPAIAGRYGFDADAIEQIRAALRESGVHWGFDASTPGRRELPASLEHTWQEAFDRLFLGLATGSDDEVLFEVAPCPLFSARDAVHLGHLRDFLADLNHWQQQLRIPREAAAWQQCLDELAGTFIDHGNHDAGRALDAIAEAGKALGREATAAGHTGLIGIDALREDLLARLEQAEMTRGAFLAGGVTFCGLKAMRSLPFAVIALLGMDANAFPRRTPRCGFDLIGLDPLPGDQVRRLDDRHLFLEILLSARRYLYLSYSGRSPQDSTASEASVVIGELLEVLVDMQLDDDARRDEGSREEMRRSLILQHPLQPFAAARFDGTDPRLLARDAAWRPVAQALHRPQRPSSPPFCAGPLPALEPGPVAVDALLRFYRHPVRAFLQERLGVYPSREAESFQDDEPFALDGLQRYALTEAWVAARLENDGRTDAAFRRLEQARGTLPQGEFGRLELDELASLVDSLHTEIQPHHAPARDIRIDLQLADGRALVGVIRSPSRQGVLRWTASAGGFGARALALWIEHLCLCAQGDKGDSADPAGSGDAPVSRLYGKNSKGGVDPLVFGPIDPPTALEHLAELVALRDEGLRAPLPLFPKTSWAWMEARLGGKDADQIAADCWNDQYRPGGSSIPGERRDEALAIAYAGIDDPCAQIPEQRAAELALRVLGPLFTTRQSHGDQA